LTECSSKQGAIYYFFVFFETVLPPGRNMY